MSLRNHGLTLALVLASTASCGEANRAPNSANEGSDSSAEKRAAFDYGTVSRGAYRNAQLEFRLPLPEDWHVGDSGVQEKVIEASKEFAEDDPILDTAVRQAEKQTHNLLMLLKHPLGAPVEFNPNLILLAEDVGGLPGITSGKDYLFHLRRNLLASKMPYQTQGEAEQDLLADEGFWQQDFLLDNPLLPVLQRYAAVKRGDFMLCVILSAGNEEQLEELSTIASQMQLD